MPAIISQPMNSSPLDRGFILIISLRLGTKLRSLTVFRPVMVLNLTLHFLTRFVSRFFALAVDVRPRSRGSPPPGDSSSRFQSSLNKYWSLETECTLIIYPPEPGACEMQWSGVPPLRSHAPVVTSVPKREVDSRNTPLTSPFQWVSPHALR